MRQQRDTTLDTYRQLCLSYIYRLAWTSTGSDGTWREYTISAGDGESLKHNSVISRICLSIRVINSLLFQRTVLISVQTHQTRLHGCLMEATIPVKASFLPIPRRKLVETGLFTTSRIRITVMLRGSNIPPAPVRRSLEASFCQFSSHKFIIISTYGAY